MRYADLLIGIRFLVDEILLVVVIALKVVGQSYSHYSAQLGKRRNLVA